MDEKVAVCSIALTRRRGVSHLLSTYIREINALITFTKKSSVPVINLREKIKPLFLVAQK